MNRRDYVLMWKDNDKEMGVCCANRWRDVCMYRCPLSPRVCSAPDYSRQFDNTRHTIIATLDECKGKSFGCDRRCPACAIYHIIKDKPKMRASTE